MIVILVECAEPSLRGELTRWLFEVKAGVFVGHVSAYVRDALWEKTCAPDVRLSGALMLHQSNTEQGFSVRIHGEPTRSVIDIEGVQLVKIQ